MSMANVTEDNILNAYFRAVTIANILINATSSPITTISYALHTADPGDAGTQATSEVTYTSYARKTVNRDTTDHSASSGGSIGPAAAVTFIEGTGGSGTMTHFSAGKTNTGATDIFWSGTVTPNQSLGNLITPSLTTVAMTLD